MHLLLPPLALTLALVRLTTALPLNINLGAYSPALVVGDGAISFEGEEGAAAGGGQSAEQIVNALQGAAVSGASAAAAAAAANNNNNNGAASVTPPAVGAAAVVQIDEPSPTVVLLNDPATSVSGKELDPRLR